MTRVRFAGVAIAAAFSLLSMTVAASAQQLDLSHGGPIDISAADGIDWRQDSQTVVAHGGARARRGDVTVLADTLTAWYRPRSAPTGSAAPDPAGPPGTGGNEIYKVEALGNVRIFTPTDQVTGERAVYDIDASVLSMTGRNLKLATPSQILTARDALEYWAQKHMAVARGNAVAVTSDSKRIAADTLVAYTAAGVPDPAVKPAGAAAAPADPLGTSGKLEKMEAFGNVSLRTPTDTVTGDRGVYVPDTGIARLAGSIRITRGQNQLNGSEAIVNMKTGVAQLIAGSSGRVSGLVLPADKTAQDLAERGSVPQAPVVKKTK